MSEEQNDFIVGNTIVRHEYDVDAFNVIDSFKQHLLNQNFIQEHIDSKKEMVELMEEMMVDRLKGNHPEIIEAQKKRHYIIPSLHNEYNDYLALKLLIIDPFKIPALLSYQSKAFLGNYYAQKVNFIGLIEFLVYQRVKSYKVVDIDLRRERIMKWVEDNRYFDFEDNTELRAKNGFLVTEAKLSQILYENLKLIVPEKRNEDLYFVLSENKLPQTPIPIAANKTQIAELFKRIKYNGACNLSNTDLANFIIKTFSSMSEDLSVHELKKSTVYDVLRRIKDEPSRGGLLFEHIVEYKLSDARKNI